MCLCAWVWVLIWVRAPQDGDTPLHIAADNGHTDVAWILLHTEVDKIAKNKVRGCGDAFFCLLGLSLPWASRGQAFRQVLTLQSCSAEWSHATTYRCIQRSRGGGADDSGGGGEQGGQGLGEEGVEGLGDLNEILEPQRIGFVVVS